MKKLNFNIILLITTLILAGILMYLFIITGNNGLPSSAQRGTEIQYNGVTVKKGQETISVSKKGFNE